MTVIFLLALLALGLALLLARETRLRRAFQSLVSRLLAKLQPGSREPGFYSSHPRRK